MFVVDIRGERGGYVLSARVAKRLVVAVTEVSGFIGICFRNFREGVCVQKRGQHVAWDAFHIIDQTVTPNCRLQWHSRRSVIS